MGTLYRTSVLWIVLIERMGTLYNVGSSTARNPMGLHGLFCLHCSYVISIVIMRFTVSEDEEAYDRLVGRVTFEDHT
jgi:hypothetical protein